MSYARNLARLARTGAPTVETAQALRDMPIYGGLYPKRVQTLGALAAGDGGGLAYRWDAESTADDLIGAALLPAGHVGAGRFLAQHRDYVIAVPGMDLPALAVYARNNERTLALMPGVYDLGATPICVDHTVSGDKRGLSMIGLGRSPDDVEIRYSGTGYAIQSAGTGPVQGTPVTRHYFANFWLNLNESATPDGGMDLRRNFLVALERVHVGNLWNPAGVLVDVRNAFNVVFRDCHLYGTGSSANIASTCAVGLYIGSPDPDAWSSSNIVFEGGLIQRTAGYGVLLDPDAVGSLDNFEIRHCSVGYNKLGGVRLASPTAKLTTVSARHCHFEVSGANDATLVIDAATGLYVEGAFSVVCDSNHSNTAHVHFHFRDCETVSVVGGYAFNFTGATVPADSVALKCEAPNANHARLHISGFAVDMQRIDTDYEIAHDEVVVTHSNGYLHAPNSWTPTIELGSGSVTLSVATGYWEVVGRMVYVVADLEIGNVSTPAGALQIRSLPRPASSAIADIGQPVAVHYSGLDLPASALEITGEVVAANDKIQLYAPRDADTSLEIGAYLVAGSRIRVAGWYLLAAS